MTGEKPTLEMRMQLEEAQVVDLEILKELQGKVVEIKPKQDNLHRGIVGRVGLQLIEMHYLINDLVNISGIPRKSDFHERISAQKIYTISELAYIKATSSTPKVWMEHYAELYREGAGKQ